MATLTLKVLMTPRPHLLTASALLIVAALAMPAQAQYLETTIPVGEEPDQLFWNPLGDKVYCSNRAENTVTIIDCQTNQVSATLHVPAGPSFFGWNPHANKVYCSSGDANRISVIDGVGDTLIHSITASGWPGRLAYCETLDKLYVSCADDCYIRIFDDTTYEQVRRLDLPLNPGPLVWNPASNRVFVSAGGDPDTVYVIDCATDSIVARRDIGPMGAPFLRHATRDVVYAPSHDSMHVFSPTGDSVLAEFGIGAYAPWYICAVPYPDKLYVGDFNGFGITVIDCAYNAVVDTLNGGRPFYCDTARGGKVYCLANGMDVYDGHADTVLVHLDFGHSLVEVTASPTQGRVYVTDQLNDVVYVVRDTTTGIAEGPTPQAQTASMLASPNPFSAGVELSGSSEHGVPGEVYVFSRTGERVAMLHPAATGAGRWRCAWDGRDALGRVVPAGVYFVRSAGLAPCSVVKTTSTL